MLFRSFPSHDRLEIGTSSPAGAYRATLTGDGSTIVGGLALSSNSNVTYIGAVGATTADSEIWNAANGYVRIGTNNAERLRIDSSGRVGIGTSSPRGRFEASYAYLSGETGAQCIFPLSVTIGYGGSDYGSIGYNLDYRSATSNATGVKYLANDTISQLDFNAGGFIFRNAPTGTSGNTATLTERLRITSGGNLLVGTTTEGGGIGFNTRTAIYSSTIDTFVSVADGGATNLGPYIAWHKATTGNNIFHSFWTEGTATNRGTIDYNRGSGVVRYNTSSDETLKNIIGDSSGAESVNILKNTKIRDFTWKSDTTNKVNVGVIAQELYNVFKGAVSVGGNIVKKDSDGNDVTTYQPWSVDKTAFTFHLVAGWQAHEKLIQELKAENDSLKTRIAALEAA